jgi:hypothetical protein
MAGPLTFYRLWCGRKRYTGWLPDRNDAFDRAVELGLAYRNDRGGGLGPLSWIEEGTRKYAHSKTVPVKRPR